MNIDYIYKKQQKQFTLCSPTGILSSGACSMLIRVGNNFSCKGPLHASILDNSWNISPANSTINGSEKIS